MQFSMNFFVVLLLQVVFSLSQQSLLDNYQRELDSPGSGFKGNNITEILRNRHIVLVDGIMNELASILNNYWADNIAALKEIGVGHTHLRYSSARGIPTNADSLYNDILVISKRVKLPIVLIGHSMGGAEAAYLFLKYPELLLDGVIEKVVCVNPAIGGSILADNLNLLGKAASLLLGSGLNSLKPVVAKKNFEDGFARFQKTIAEAGYKGGLTPSSRFEYLSKKLYYVRTALSPADISEFPNDRLLTAKDQMIQSNPAIGVDLGILEGDHIELVVNGFVSSGDVFHRKAFTRALLQKLFSN
ncbi:hypothetical protein HK099_002136 [Clydaea vesicula]|uniref:Serine aminopeptidase S33 domain-containing protein n=1 Tax=Clydaea vesicula TaxID=447962 RepID=A0AAD5XZF3_9FUNG|nr:hypothetical protein HK099_002136 [Clydaea vesicula]